MIVMLHPKVDDDLLQAMKYYEAEAVAELALEFYFEFRRCADEIAERPESFSIIASGLRRMNLHRFPFHILFEIHDNNEAQIFAVKHDRREPSFGTDRR